MIQGGKSSRMLLLGCSEMPNTLYQHIMIFGRDRLYVTRFDNSADTEKVFSSYNEALLYCIYYLSTARVET